MTTATKAKFSFLTSGPWFTFELPSALETTPELSSPIFSGVGARDFVFTPEPHGTELADGLAAHGELLDVLSDKDGRPVSHYRRLEPPLTWWLVWKLTEGSLTTHLREVDGIDRAKVVMASLSIVEGSVPFLLLELPLRPAAGARPDFVERATFSPTEAGTETIVFQRPGYVAAGKVVAFPSDDWIQLRAGTPYGVEVQVISSVDRRAALGALSTVLGTLTDVAQ
jgi:hypothetical protein